MGLICLYISDFWHTRVDRQAGGSGVVHKVLADLKNCNECICFCVCVIVCVRQCQCREGLIISAQPPFSLDLSSTNCFWIIGAAKY